MLGAGRPAGIGGAFEPQPGVAELVSMWVHPRARGQGVAAALVDMVLHWARAGGHHRVQPLASHPELAEIAMACPA